MHDTTEYADAFVDVNVTFDIKQRHYQEEIQKEIFELLAQRAPSLNMPVQKIIDEVLGKELVSAQEAGGIHCRGKFFQPSCRFRIGIQGDGSGI
jgi:hypothetical protein